MGKYKVGVGDAFPVEQTERPIERDDDRRAWGERDRGPRGHRHDRGGSNFLFKATLILLVIWGALHMFNGHGPRGLLIAAAITFGVAVVNRLFSPRRERRRHEEAR